MLHRCRTFRVLKSNGSVQIYIRCLSDLRQELAVRQKERRPSSSLGKDSDRSEMRCSSPPIPITPSKPAGSYMTPPASSIRRGNDKLIAMDQEEQIILVLDF